MDSIQTLKNIKTLANKTMTNKFEHLGVSDEDIIKIINQEKTTIDEHDYRTIWQFNQGVEFILTQNHQMTFDDILFLHSIIGKKLALNAGEFAFSKRVVSGETDDEFFEISPISETQVREEFESFSLTGFGTITDSDKLPFIKPIFQGTGEENQKEIEKVLTNTATFNSNDLTFQKWFDTGIYPPNTTFTILNSKKSHVSLLFTHFHIEVEANQYYAGNTTIHQPQVRTVEIKEQLIYTPTNIIVKPTHIFPQIETTEFSEYIDYNSSSNHFDILKLSKFLTFINVDSTETKLMNLKFSDNIATFDLVSNTWIDENGLGCYDPDPANSKTFSFSLKLLAPKPPIIPPTTPTPPGSTTTPSVTNSSPLDTNTIIAIGVTTSATAVVLILLLTLLLIKRYKRKITNDFNMVLYDENFSGHPQTSRQRRYSKQRSKESNVKQG